MWSLTPTLADGTYSLTASETDIAGNTGSTTLSFTLDTVAPAAPAGLALSAASDSGTLSDRITNVALPTLTGTGEEGATVTLFAGDAAIGTGLVTDGNWSIAATTGLTPGVNVLTARQTNLTGSVSGASNALDVIFDATAPTATIVVADTTLAAGETSLVTVTFSEAITGLTNADLSVATGTLSDVTSSDGGITWTTTLTPNAGVSAPDNLITLDNAGVLDTAGNPGIGTTASNNFAINTAAPPPTGLTLDPASDSGTKHDGITSDTTPTITGIAVPGDTVTLFVNGGTAAIGTALADGTSGWSITSTATLADGLNTLTAISTDAAGNTSAPSAVLAVTVDTAAPVVSSSTISVVQDAGAANLGIAAPIDSNFTPDQLIIIAGTLPTDGRLTLSDGTTAVTFGQKLTSAELTGLLFTPTRGLSGASSAFTYTVTNPAGTASPGAVTLAIGLLAPVLTTVNEIVNDAISTITGTAALGSTVTLLSNNTPIGIATADATTGAFAVTPSTPFALGPNTLSATATSGNDTSMASVPIDVFDIQRPIFGISTTDFSSADIGAAMRLGAKPAFIGGTEAILLTDSTLSVGLDTNEATIQRLYEGLLGRSNDTGGISFFDTQLTAGVSKATIADDFLNSPEYAVLHGPQTDDQFVTSLYQGLLGRAPEPEGLTAWTGQLAQGTSRGDVVVAFADSEEAKLHLASTTTQVYVPNAAGTLAHELYETGLGREVEMAGLPFYEAAYLTQTPSQIAAAIATSPEFAARHAGQSNNAYVNSLYQAGLSRPPEPGAVGFWTDQLNSGSSRGDVLLSIATSSEAAAHLTHNLSA